MQVTESLLNEMVEAIREEVDPEQVILFGSYARGNQKLSSDLDFLIIESMPFGLNRSRLEESTRLYKKLARFHIPKDILVYSHDQVEEWRGSLNHVISRALREGRILYRRS